MNQHDLFGSTEPPAPMAPAPAGRQGPFAQVAIEQHLDRVLDYAIPKALAHVLKVGQRVRVPLGRGNRPTYGYVVGLVPTSQHKGIKNISAIDDERVLVTPVLMELARWMARYYCCPLGTVLESVIPAAVKKRIGLDYTPMVRLAVTAEQAQAALEKMRAPKRRAVLAQMLQLESGHAIALPRLAGESHTTPATVRKLIGMGLLALSHEPDYQSIAPRAHTVVHPEIIPQLNEDQQKAFDDLAPRLAGGGFSVNLLFGVTGSGKTEVYLRCIERVIQSGRRAIVLVPEIALTPQTVRRFTARFARVAVLHSGLGATQRHRYWQQILTGQADVVVGARSAIFAPLPDLGIIVVDEEHESSYKQDSAPRYHGRDLAIKRAQLQNVPIILGSATPSLETYCRVTEAQSQPQATSPYHLLQLPRRVRGLELPVAELVNMRAEARARRGVHLLSRRLEGLLRTTLQQKQQAILLLNRRGYANYIYCPSCQYVMQCKFCDATLTYHRLAEHRVGSAKIAQGVHTGQLHCHYCLAVVPLSPACPQCGKSLTLFGMGTQRVEEELARKFPDVRFARMDSDSMHYARDYEELLGRFADGQIQVLLGTQVIAKGLDYPNVTLVGVVSADTALALPDFRAAERTFQLITQVAGRCGRGQTPGRVVVQTFQPDSPAIRAGLTQDYPGFARLELSQRRQVGLPPLTRMVRIVMRDQDLQKLHDRAAKVAQALAPAVAAQGALVRMREPAPCAISRIAGHHRQQIVLFSPSGGALQRVLAEVRGSSGFTEGDRVAIDVDPVSLL